MSSFYYGRIPFDPTICTDVLSHQWRALWSQYVIYQRNYIIAALNRSGDVQNAAEMMVKCQYEIAASWGKFFGTRGAAFLRALLNNEDQFLVAVVGDTLAGDTQKLKQDVAAWYKAGTQLALYISESNPKYWPFRKIIVLVQEHIKYLTDQITARHNKQWILDTNAFNKSMAEILRFSDVITDGITRRQNDRNRFIVR